MKRNVKKIKKTIISLLSSAVLLSATNITIANAASATVTGHTSNGYRVASTASYSGKTVTGEGQVLRNCKKINFKL